MEPKKIPIRPNGFGFRNSFGTRNSFPSIKPGQRSNIGNPGNSAISSNWVDILLFLKGCNSIRKSICGGCGSGKLYDKNDKMYIISRKMTVDEVKNIAELIKKINNEKE